MDSTGLDDTGRALFTGLSTILPADSRIPIDRGWSGQLHAEASQHFRGAQFALEVPLQCLQCESS